MSKSIESGKRTLKIEAETLLDQMAAIGESFEAAVQEILNSGGKLIVTGMGKSGIVGKKMAATFASTGTPSFFMHPGEAFHGDLGMLEPKDVVLALSFSGETDELLKIIPFFKSNGNALLSITGNAESTLAKHSKHHMVLAVKQEACPLHLAPTSSTTATLALGDALAVAVMEARDFKPEDFARFHPGGSLGKKLLTNIETVMRTENLPIIASQSSLIEIISTISAGKLGLALVNEGSKTVGIITDGDLRRLMEAKGKAAFDLSAVEIMSTSPKSIAKNTKLSDAEAIFIANKINSLIITNESDETIGIVQIFDLNK